MAGQILSSSVWLAQNLRTIKRRLNQYRVVSASNLTAQPIPKLNLTNRKKGGEPLAIACKFSPNIKNTETQKCHAYRNQTAKFNPAFTKNLAELDGKFKSGLAQICHRGDRFFMSSALNFTPKSGKAKFIRAFLIVA